jgi:hypothetical protein
MASGASKPHARQGQPVSHDRPGELGPRGEGGQLRAVHAFLAAGQEGRFAWSQGDHEDQGGAWAGGAAGRLDGQAEMVPGGQAGCRHGSGHAAVRGG